MPDTPWTPPSDDLLLADKIAQAKVQHPHPAVNVTDAGIVLPDTEDDAVIEARAAAVLAELDPDDDGEPTSIDDDDAVDDPDDDGAVDDV